jgi:hypothetical protein
MLCVEHHSVCAFFPGTSCCYRRRECVCHRFEEPRGQAARCCRCHKVGLCVFWYAMPVVKSLNSVSYMYLRSNADRWLHRWYSAGCVSFDRFSKTARHALGWPPYHQCTNLAAKLNVGCRRRRQRCRWCVLAQGERRTRSISTDHAVGLGSVCNGLVRAIAGLCYSLCLLLFG